jgi:aminopeptidase-like protein
MIKIIEDLWFLRRDIVSDGFDDALKYISKIIPLKIHKIPTGKKCWTWTVPEKWSVEDAYVETMNGKKIIDLKDHPLHVMSYSLSVNKIVSKEELLKHIHSSPARPKAIPFEFKYYERDWGFCIQNEKIKQIKEPKYKVFIDSKFEKGALKVGDYTIRGKSEKTIVLVAHLCHPCQVNDDLAGVAVLVDLARELAKKNNYYTYKFLLVPETIGSVAYLSQNEGIISKLKFGIFLEMLGNSNGLSLQLSYQGNTKIDRIAKEVMKKRNPKVEIKGFREIVRNDEMVFNGPGVDIPMVSISRWPYPEYHTSDDNLKIISNSKLLEAKETVLDILEVLEKAGSDKDYVPKRIFRGPVFLSKYNLWVDWRINKKLNQNIEKIMLMLNGNKSVSDIADELGLEFDVVLSYVNKFLDKKLVKKVI